MPWDLAEPLFKPFGQHSCARIPRARPRASATGALLKLQNPSHRVMHAGTIEISRLTHPQPPILKECCTGVNPKDKATMHTYIT